MLTALEDIFPVELAPEDLATEHTDREELVHKLHADAITLYNAREEELGEELMRAVERFVLLQFIDQRWREHLYDMDYLREGIHLRGFAQIEPIVAYKNEAFTLFEDLMASIWPDFTRMIFNLEVEALEEDEEPRAALRAERDVDATRPRVVLRRRPGPAERARARRRGRRRRSYVEEDFEAPPPVQQRVLSDEQTVGRNDPCWCGSGKKFKKCHGA